VTAAIANRAHATRAFVAGFLYNRTALAILAATIAEPARRSVYRWELLYQYNSVVSKDEY
jgi:hypothetical protein